MAPLMPIDRVIAILERHVDELRTWREPPADVAADHLQREADALRKLLAMAICPS